MGRAWDVISSRNTFDGSAKLAVTLWYRAVAGSVVCWLADRVKAMDYPMLHVTFECSLWDSRNSVCIGYFTVDTDIMDLFAKVPSLPISLWVYWCRCSKISFPVLSLTTSARPLCSSDRSLVSCQILVVWAWDWSLFEGCPLQ